MGAFTGREGSEGSIKTSKIIFGFGISLAVGVLFSYIVEDISAPQYLLELISLFIVEVPFIAFFAVLARKYPWQWSALFAAASFCASYGFFFPGIALTPVIYLKVILMGFFTGLHPRSGGTFFRRMSSIIAPGVLLGLLLGGSILYWGVSPEMKEVIRNDTQEVYRAFIEEDDAQNETDNAMIILESFFSTAVAFFILYTVVEAWFAFLLSNWLFVRFREQPESRPLFSSFKLPFHMVWIFLGSGLFSVLEVPLVTPLAVNILTVMGGLYCIQGLAITIFHMNRLSLGSLPKIIFWVIFIFSFSIIGIVLIIIGMVDNWFNLRPYPVRPGGNREGSIDETHSERRP